MTPTPWGSTLDLRNAVGVGVYPADRFAYRGYASRREDSKKLQTAISKPFHLKQGAGDYTLKLGRVKFSQKPCESSLDLGFKTAQITPENLFH